MQGALELSLKYYTQARAEQEAPAPILKLYCACRGAPNKQRVPLSLVNIQLGFEKTSRPPAKLLQPCLSFANLECGTMSCNSPPLCYAQGALQKACMHAQ